MNSWNAGTTGEGSIYVDFISQYGWIDGHMFELDGDIFPRIDVGPLCVMSLMKQLGSFASVTYINRAEAAFTYLPLQPIFIGDT